MTIIEENQEILDHFLEQLESFGLEIGTQLDQIEKEKNDYLLFQKIKEEIEKSKINFSTSYMSLEDDKKEEFQKRLLKLFKDQEIVDNILQEIVNLYYLKEEELLDLEELSAQKELAFENLNTLLTKIEKYLQETSIEELTEEEGKLSLQLDRLVLLGSILEGEELLPIEDIDFLEESLERSNLSDQEKRLLLGDLIRHNIEMYQMGPMEPKKEEKKEEEEVEEEIFVMPPDFIKEIEELLSDPEIIERIVKVVNDDFMVMIHIKNATEEEKEQVESAMDLIRDEMTTSIQEEGKTPREALEEFFLKYDETLQRKREELNRITFHGQAENYTEEEIEDIMEEAFSFAEEREKMTESLSRDERERIHQFMTNLYQEKENRRQVYERKAYEGEERVEVEAAYEILVLRELLEVVSKEDIRTRSILAHKMKEILDCVKEIQSTIEVPKEEQGTLYFLMEGDTSVLENDLGFGSNSGMVSNAQYSEVKNQIHLIQNRSEINMVGAQPVNASFKAMKKQGIRYTSSARTKVYFIPIGKKDSIVVGASLTTGRDVMRDQDQRIRRYAEEIAALKERINNPETQEEERQKSEKALQRILLGRDLQSMFTDSVGEEPIQYQK